MADEGTPDTFEHTIAGRSMVFKHVERGQLLMLQRLIRLGQADMQAAAAREDDEAVKAQVDRLNDLIWGTVESLFTSPQDLAHVQMAVLRREASEADVMAILYGGKQVQAPDDDADPAPVKRAAKAAKKTVKSASAKANPTRAKR